MHVLDRNVSFQIATILETVALISITQIGLLFFTMQ